MYAPSHPTALSPVLTRILQARKAAALVDSLSPEDPNHAAQMEKETEEERAAITKTCKQLKLHIKEVRTRGLPAFTQRIIAEMLLRFPRLTPMATASSPP